MLDFHSSRVTHVRGYVVSEPEGSLQQEAPGPACSSEEDDSQSRRLAGYQPRE